MGFPIDGCNLSTCVQLEQCLLLTELNTCKPGGFLSSRSRNAMSTGVGSASTEAATVFEQHAAS